ncbi:ommochrome-binding protein-like [Helicoverpa zea]|uniref:ommochrome-binding protein-like n=1 Tax=Helicoverpa zea TaxID=7113 RepID=UPI001F58A0E5|nr:ommochrome-binding protein [Helicoverpa armigera]XP_047022385.1 ommochrome-binding protein-like [Helicoverpa zea]XP_047022386.1 ommochrome-binding protein-like [Helicoverpa zea]
MKFYILALVLAVADAGLIFGDTNCVIIHNVNFEKEILKSDVQSPYQLAIDHDTNTLFFSYTARTDEMFKIAYLSLKTGDFGIVSGIHGGFATAIDRMSHVIYMGGDDGIYRFDYDNKDATNLHINENSNIWQMFYKNALYFTTYPEEKAYVYKSKKLYEIADLLNVKVMLIAVNRQDNLVYTNSSGVFLYSKTDGSTIQLNNGVANGITADIEGNLYFSTASAIYSIDDKTNAVERLARLENTYGMAIDNAGNIIYATEDSIIRLKPSRKVCIDDKLFSKSVDEVSASFHT